MADAAPLEQASPLRPQEGEEEEEEEEEEEGEEEKEQDTSSPTEPPPLSTLSISTPPPPTTTTTTTTTDTTDTTGTTPPHLSHVPGHNLKRSDPFQFGSRHLTADDDVYEWNAWDHVDPAQDAAFTAHAAAQYALQRAHGVGAFDRARFDAAPERWWDRFYGHHGSNFFRDRRWLAQEFPVLALCCRADGDGDADADATGPWDTILEIGAGAGNTAFPIARAGRSNPRLRVHACDFSAAAVRLLRADALVASGRVRAEVWDMTARRTLPAGVAAGSVDVVLLVFAFSALRPARWGRAVRNAWAALRPGGEVCFRDYGRGDLAQVRFRKARWLEENFYVRGDGTRVYFFAEDELRAIWGGGLAGLGRGGEDGDEDEDEKEGRGEGEGEAEAEAEAEADDEGPVPAFEILSLAADRRLLVNRQKQLKMYRCWMQGRFRKPFDAPAPAPAAVAAAAAGVDGQARKGERGELAVVGSKTGGGV